jgi:hypothetical protein
MSSTPRPRLVATLLSLFALVPVGEAAAQNATYPNVRLGGRVQAQYAHSSMESAENEFFFRRVRLRADIELNEWISGRIQPDFAGGGASLQDAYVSFGFSDAFEVTVGQFKRPFDLFDLSSSTDLSVIERDGRVEGVSVCPGVESVCSHTRIAESLLFAGRDQGVMIEGSSGQLTYSAMVSNGEGANTSDVNDGKSFSARVTLQATEDLRVSGKLAAHDYLDPADDTEQAFAFGMDAEWGTWRDGLHAQLYFTTGDNWKLLGPGADPATFRVLEGWLAYYEPLDGDRVVGIEPLVRIGHADADTDGADDAGLTITPGLMFYFGGRNKFGANLDVYRPQTGDTEYSLKLQTYLYF